MSGAGKKFKILGVVIMAKKIVMVVAHVGYQPVEYGEPKKIFRASGFTVVTASDKTGIAHAKDNSTTQVDITLDKLNLDDVDALLFIGGPGSLEWLDNDLSYRLIQDAQERDIVIGAICLSTRILAKAGALVSTRATGWDGDFELQKIYDKHAVIYVQAPVVTDNKRVTAQGPAAAEGFAYAVKALL